MLLVTGATGFIGSSLLPRLTEEGTPVRCLVRDPRRLGAERVRVQISLGELTDHRALRNAVRGVRTVIHLGAGAGDQPRATLQELGSIATWRLVEAAERAGVERMLFFTPLGAGPAAPTPLLRDKALAEEAVASASFSTTTFAMSLVTGADDELQQATATLARLPLFPLAGGGRGTFQPAWVEDVVAAIEAVLARGEQAGHERIELAGPDRLGGRQLARLGLRALPARRLIVPATPTTVSSALRLLGGRAALPKAWNPEDFLGAAMVSDAGTAGFSSLGISPLSVSEVLGLA